MIKRFILIVVTTILLVVLSGCTAPVISDPVPVPEGESIEITEPTSSTPVPLEVNTETPTPTSSVEPTLTPTLTPTPTMTMTPTSTPIPIYTELGLQAVKISEILNWRIVVCDETIKEEDFDKGIFKLTENTGEFFCDFEGHMEEPVPNEPVSVHDVLGQLVLSLSEYKQEKNGVMTVQYIFCSSLFLNDYFPNPSSVYVDEVLAFLYDGKFKNIEEYREQSQYIPIILRMWPLTDKDLEKILSDPYFSDKVWYTLTY